MTSPAITPQQRRRAALPRKVILTAAMTGQEIRHRFILRQRLVFTALMLLCLAAPFAPLLGQSSVRWGADFTSTVFWLLAGLGLTSFALAVFRRRGQTKRWSLLPGWAFCIGGLAALFAPVGDPKALLAYWANPMILAGVSLLGYCLNTWLIRQEIAAWKEFFLTGPWFLGACTVLLFLFPAGEWALGVSGAATLLLLFCMHFGARETVRSYQASEWIWASFDLVPTTLASTVRVLAGKY
ncbi:MAG: hypothetical protein JXR96_13695 [Deltaproteobacteria bacterium]|nr:hypothetical protein [Deltaproteobacteria bacterium]